MIRRYAVAVLLAALVGPGAVLAHGPAALTKKGSQLRPERCDAVETVDECHQNYPTGCSLPKDPTKSSAPRYDAYLNYFKNQTPKPTLQPVKVLSRADFSTLERRLPSDLKKGHTADHADELAALGQGQVFAVIGYLYLVQVTGAESTNCELHEKSQEQTDYHIHIGFEPLSSDIASRLRGGTALNAEEQLKLQQTSIIVEMTPHYRLWHQPTWHADKLIPNIGRQVKVVGQLLADTEHDDASANCAHPNVDTSKCWRASIWELHPVIEFYVCAVPICAADSPSWKRLKDLP